MIELIQLTSYWWRRPAWDAFNGKPYKLHPTFFSLCHGMDAMIFFKIKCISFNTSCNSRSKAYQSDIRRLEPQDIFFLRWRLPALVSALCVITVDQLVTFVLISTHPVISQIIHTFSSTTIKHHRDAQAHLKWRIDP
jgi:hypothetical protein